MKTILVPTDFSKTAENAARYAIQLSTKLKAQVILLHVYIVPVAPYEVTMGVLPEQDFKELFTSRLKALAAKLNKTNPTDFALKAVCVNGSPEQQILNYAERHKVDMIVMGTHGESASFTRLFGNTTSFVVRKTCIPVLAVPHYARYREIRNVLVSCDKLDSFTDPIIYTLESLSKTFHAKLNMVRVFR
ncbi:MAG: universal stress protein, partial [Bacteroidia bacterium]